MQGANRDRDTQHEDGNLFIPTLDVINRANPAIVLLENSDNMLNSDTLALMDSVMSATGYYKTHTVLNGHEHGDFELRKRLCVVWVSKGLTGLDADALPREGQHDRIVADILEPISDTDKAWKDLSHVAKKNNEKSHSHKMCVVNDNDTKMPAIIATYAKIKADTPFVAHPTNSGLHRILTVSEHANVRRMAGEMKKAIVSVGDGTHHLTNRTNATAAHMMLGNSITPQPWASMGSFIGDWLVSLTKPAVKDAIIKTTVVVEDSGQYALAL